MSTFLNRKLHINDIIKKKKIVIKRFRIQRMFNNNKRDEHAHNNNRII